MSADDDWYGELFKNELKAVSAAQVTVEASDSEYEVYFYNRHFGLDFALGQHTGCCVVAGVDALQEQLREAFSQTSLRLAKKKGKSWWSLVTRPAVALLASLALINWTMPNTFVAVDDLGDNSDFIEASPGAVAGACRNSVRRWRLLKVG